MSEKHSIYFLIDVFENEFKIIKSLNLKDKINNYIIDEEYDRELNSFSNNKEHIQRIIKFMKYYYRKKIVNKKKIKSWLLNLFSANNFYGQYCELMAYVWMFEMKIKFTPQVMIDSEELLNKKRVELDGVIDKKEIYFDIKSFGIQFYAREIFRRKLQEQFKGKIVYIEGLRDSSYKDISKYAFDSMKDIVEALEKKHSYFIEGLRWNIRILDIGKDNIKLVKKRQRKEFDPYRFARENKFFCIRKASQFTINKPFILICSFSDSFNNFYDKGNLKNTNTALRALARRTFMELNKCNKKAIRFDGRLDDNLLVKDVVKYISALIFINFNSGMSRIFLNPYGQNKIKKSDIFDIINGNRYTDFEIDDFEYDIY
ncbi:hypothetical protein [Oceanirhabdus sp. W0125-5]|uniref:hypothetical protein n=1 Tax=Oceanirhabdus sp. W0125-5 TaxID=2999116 RepID=UPI0022F33A50|nr:hypothetical protein [Oceanirhabdus sp. W0125-5]WBW94691.1 hypothetical protein OW730_13395 [Oceanirhabdus sp. W0125-5]